MPLFCLSAASTARAQILYTVFQPNSTFALRQVNGDGTGDTAVATPFPNLSFPAWSRDRALVALTATNPDNPGPASLNVFTFNPATGARANVTNFQDFRDAQGASYQTGYHKAFSPDRKFLAVNSVITSTANNGGTTNTPILQIFGANGEGLLATVHVGLNRDALHHDGEGISWSPTQSLLATPVELATRLQSGAGVGETTAIFLAEPVTNAGNARQLTFPHADQVATPTQGYVYSEHDYQPKFSPDGALVAYVRSLAVAYTANGGVPSPDQQSLHIINVNSGADTTVLQLPQGQYVTTLDWSPDGSALVFDAGQEFINSGIPGQAVEPATDQVYVINVNGSGLRQLRGTGSGMPAWEPLPGAAAHPAFFNGETALSNGVFFLQFPSGNPFGYYSYLTDPHYIFHFDLGYEYVFDAADGKSGVYLYDFKSGGFFYTSPGFPFPYLYDFTLKTVLYYYPDPNNAGHYNTNGVRYFFDFATGGTISK